MTDARDRYVERMGAALSDAGLQRLPSRVFAALTSDDDGRMTSAELVETLRVSPASVSGAVRYLAQIGFLHRERERGGRRDVYVVDDDAWLQAMLREDQVYAPMVTALDDALRDLPDASPARHRLLLMREFLVFVGGEMDGIAQRWLARRAEIEQDLG
ncbi:GbsR/MarR family transcriptional regulator [Nocardioides euryhalodurans]|uniref:Transcriptional regulator TrmB n=1 Tax=Nocardioides euryhalodurans TaxID=2518370 RepID=A0A4P7GH42_9ACTN|nr:MarR family transcriptional regulator [Nocardioides euryhalodurans]QBR91073.1 transcriptional regulator TrmB [Nocardioides euryhalodurans]